MKIDIVYTTKSKYIKCVADEMARWVKTHAQDLNHYHSDHDVDLLVIGLMIRYLKINSCWNLYNH